jgi:hypothetical protein
MIHVVLPSPLRALARIEGRVVLEIEGPATQRALLDALETRHPALAGTIRERATGKRRAYVRFYACGRDLSDAAPDDPLPDDVVRGAEPYVVLGAIAGG